MKYSFKRKILHLFFPTRCPICGDIIGAVERFCKDCEDRLTKYDGSFTIDGADSFTAAFEYDDTVKPAVFLLKDGVCGNAAYALGGALADRLSAVGLTCDVIVPAPMHRHDVHKRGFNQSALIAREVGRILNIPVDIKAVAKTKRTHTQKGLNKIGRVLNLSGAFCASERVNGKRILLIDDICTTGSTLREISTALKKAGAASIDCACCCKTSSRRD